MTHAIATPPPAHLSTLTNLQRVFFGFLADYEGATRDLYEYHLTRFLTWCQTHQLDPLNLDRTHVALYVRHLSEGCGLRGSSVNTAMTPIKGMYRWAMLEGHIDRDPVVHVRLPKVDYRQKYPLDREELRRVRAAAKALGGRHWALGELLCVHALRISEACGIQIENYRETERGHRVLTFRRKGGRLATVPLPIPVIMALDDAAGDRTSGPVITRRDGGPLTRAGWRRPGQHHRPPRRHRQAGQPAPTPGIGHHGAPRRRRGHPGGPAARRSPGPADHLEALRPVEEEPRHAPGAHRLSAAHRLTGPGARRTQRTRQRARGADHGCATRPSASGRAAPAAPQLCRPPAAPIPWPAA